MSDSDSDEGPLVRVDSGPKKYKTVPADTEFFIKLIGVKKRRLNYKLKEGYSLPYQVELEGHLFNFDECLTLTMINDPLWVKQELEVKSGTTWNVFKLEVRDNADESVHKIPELAPAATVNENRELAPAATVNLDGNVVEVLEVDANVAAVQQLCEQVEDNHRCIICGFLSPDSNVVLVHIVNDHQNWQELLETGKRRKLGNVNNYPEWKKDLEKNFQETIISKCSLATRTAWNSNEKIADRSKFQEVRTEILKELVNHIVAVYGIVSTPNHKTLDAVLSDILSPGYPFMFGQNNDSAANVVGLGFGYGLGGMNGLKTLSKNLWDRIYQKQTKLKKALLQSAAAPNTHNDGGEGEDEGNDESLATAPRKGKKPFKYGIDNYKFYATCDDDKKANYQASIDLQNVEEREKVYEANRNAISEQIRSSEKVINRVVRGFFSSPIHLKNQFLFLSPGSDDLETRIETNWSQQVGYMELYIERKDKKGKEKLKLLDEKVAAEYSGSLILKQIMVVRLLANLIDSDGKAFFLFVEEDLITNGPFIKVLELPDRTFVFEIWADRVKILDGQQLFPALSSYFELCFVFQLEYPQQAQTVINIIQRRIAHYGDESGTLTKMRKDTALNKLTKYYQVLGDITTDPIK